jgi:hypothetical protein
VEKSYNVGSREISDTWKGSLSKTLAKIFTNYSIEAGALKKHYLSVLISFCEFSPKCPCLPDGSKKISKNLALKESNKLKTKYNMEFYENKSVLRDEFLKKQNFNNNLAEMGGG